MEPTSPKPVRKSQLSTILGDLSRGKVTTEIDEAMLEIAEGIEDIGGVGELTIKLKFRRTQRGELEVTSDVTKKVPKAKRPASLFFYDRDKQTITREDPKQRLFLEEANIVSESKGE